MGVRNLDKMFTPKSVCVIGATQDEMQSGHVVIRNMIMCGFGGAILPVGSKDAAICGILPYSDIHELPIVPDLAVICSDYLDTHSIMDQLGQKGVRAVILMSEQNSSSKVCMLDSEYFARQYGMRILGPNSLGAIIPSKKLNVSTLHMPVTPGKIAFVSQSATITSAVLDWANGHGIGFSHFISMGDCQGVSFGDIIDYLGSDPFTRAILIYMESISERRNFMSAARAAARNKPIIVMKAGKYENPRELLQSHSRALAHTDLVYDAAFKRAGMLRVDNIAELFAAAETLSVTKPFRGKRLAIVANGVGLNTIASDDLIANGGRLCELSEETCLKIKQATNSNIEIKNPINISPYCTPDHYAKTYEIIKNSKEADCILFLHAPNIKQNAQECAQALIDAHKKLKGNILTCWVGEQSIEKARRLFEQNQIATYASPRMAVTAFMHIVNYRKNQTMLMETPERVPGDFKPERAQVRKLLHDALSKGHKWLTENESNSILKAYGIETVPAYTAQTAHEAKIIANDLGYPVVVKVMSPDILHKSDVGGVVLSLENERAVEEAITAITARVRTFDESATIDGFIIQKMVSAYRSRELIAGMTHDPVFGPVMLFGAGGTATELIGDRAIALPPLNMALARDLVSRTQISRLLESYGDTPAVDKQALYQLLIELSEICIDFPEIKEMDINPIFSSHKGALAVDTRMRIEAVTHAHPNRRLAIRSYPASLEEEFVLRNGRKTIIRPIRPEDEPAHNEFLSKITPEDIRFRFFGSVRELPHTEMARLTQIDYDREMAFIAQAPNEEDGHMETLGVVRTGTDPNNENAEYAILVRSDLKGQKLGWKLLNKMIDYCRARGTKYFTGQILRENRTMIEMVKAMGFETHTNIEDDIVEVSLKL